MPSIQTNRQIIRQSIATDGLIDISTLTNGLLALPQSGKAVSGKFVKQAYVDQIVKHIFHTNEA